MKYPFACFWLLLGAVVLAQLLSSCSSPDSKSGPEPINPNATPEARALLKFLYDIKGQYILAGQHNYINTGSKYTEMVNEITGSYPVVWGSDFSFCFQGEGYQDFQHCGPLNVSDPADSAYLLKVTPTEIRDKLIEEIKKKHAQSHIITLMWHGCYPPEGDCCHGSSIWAFEKRPTPAEWEQLVTPGTELNTAWKKQADVIAGYLKQLQAANIPVLWRPYHEMNGVWFWWCNHPGENGFKKLWIMMYDYFVQKHQLNNLLWVWNTNAPRDIPGDEAGAYEKFFPGLDYVDILAADVYRKDYKQSHHDDLLKLAAGKPIVLGELGQFPDPAVLDQQPHWEWFMTWGYLLVRSNDEATIRAIYQHPRVLTLNEVARDQRGNYQIK